MLPFSNAIFAYYREHNVMVFLLAASVVLGFVIVDIAVRFGSGLFTAGAAAPASAEAVVSTEGERAYDLQAITAAHLFGVAPSARDEVARPTPTKLPLQLFGVIAGANQRFARVLIGSASHPPKSYAIGQTIRGTDAKVHAITSGRVVLQRGAALEQLALARPTLDNQGARSVPRERVPVAHNASAPPAPQSVAAPEVQATQPEVDQRRFRFF